MENVIILIVTSKNVTYNSVIISNVQIDTCSNKYFFFIHYWHKKCWYYIIISLFPFYSSFLFFSTYPKLIKNCRRSKAVKNGFVIQLIVRYFVYKCTVHFWRKIFLFSDHNFVMIPFWFSVLLKLIYFW